MKDECTWRWLRWAHHNGESKLVVSEQCKASLYSFAYILFALLMTL